MNLTSKSALITFRIWFFALLFNTVVGSFILGGIDIDFMMYFVVGGMCGLIFSFPVFLVLWPTLA